MPTEAAKLNSMNKPAVVCDLGVAAPREFVMAVAREREAQLYAATTMQEHKPESGADLAEPWQ